MQDDESREQNRRIRKLFALIRVIRGQKLRYKNCTNRGTLSYKKCKNRGTPCRSPARQQGGTFNLYVTPSLTIGPPQESVLQILAKPWNKPQNYWSVVSAQKVIFVFIRVIRGQKLFLQELLKRWNIMRRPVSRGGTFNLPITPFLRSWASAKEVSYKKCKNRGTTPIYLLSHLLSVSLASIQMPLSRVSDLICLLEGTVTLASFWFACQIAGVW